MNKVVILMGSKSDLQQAEKIKAALAEFGVEGVTRIASAHRTPAKVLGIAREYGDASVFIVVAGLSNALSGMLACATPAPVISCPVYAPEDLLSSLRMPAGVAHATVLKPENAALMAAKIIGFKDKAVAAKVKEYLAKAAKKIEDDDQSVKA